MPKIELSLEQLQNLQDVFLLIDAIKSTVKLFEKFNMPEIEAKVNSLIGDKRYMFKRQEYEDGIRRCYKDNPSEMKCVLEKLDTDMPFPEIYQQH